MTDDELFKKAGGIVLGYMNERAQPAKLGFLARRKVKAATRDLENLQARCSDNWRLLWVLGKAYQILGDESRSYDCFKHATTCCDENNKDVYREASIQAMKFGHGIEAEQMALRAVEINPNEAGLYANLALSQIIQYKLDDAERNVDTSLSIDPSDQVSMNIKQLIGSIRLGHVQCPSHF